MAILDTRLITLKARDVMTRQPITLCETSSLASAVATLERHQVTGAPVVDQGGRLVGMLSLWDIVRTAEKEAVPKLSEGTSEAEFPSKKLDVLSRSASSDAATVRERMSPMVGTVTDGQSLYDVARLMCEKHWHRVPVVDNGGRLLGIIFTMDVLAAFVNTFDESA